MSEQAQFVEGRERRRPGPKLEPRHRDLIKTLIIVGHSNATIRTRLEEAGCSYELSLSILSKYRGLASVRDAKDAALVAARQSGFGDMAKRLETLSSIAEDLVTRLGGDLGTQDLVALIRELRGVFKSIGELVDPKRGSKLEISGPSGIAAPAIQIHNTVNPNLKGMWNDMLKMFAEENGVLLIEPGDQADTGHVQYHEQDLEFDPLEGS